jgi:uncharacterized protein
MLLPSDCLAYDVVSGRLLPSWLGEADTPFIESVIEGISVLEGLSTADAEIAARGILGPLARQAKVPLRLVEALWSIERSRWTALVDAPASPEELREVLFELAARLPRDEAMARAAARFGIDPETVMGNLFADRRSRRIWVAPPERPRAIDLVARYNLALAQSLLARSMEVEATLMGDPALLIAAAKRDGLLVRFEEVANEGCPDTTRITITGPLAIFHDTAKYGRMIARFMPAIVAMRGWSLRARLMLGQRSLELALDHQGAIAFAATMPAAPDGRLARRVSRALRSAGVRVDLHPGVVRSGSALVLPDFALELPTLQNDAGRSRSGPTASSGARVLVDVVPFATPEYLAAKAEAIARLPVPMLVCVDERFVGTARSLSRANERPWLVPYRREIDAWTLYEAALSLVCPRFASAQSLERAPAPQHSLP